MKHRVKQRRWQMRKEIVLRVLRWIIFNSLKENTNQGPKKIQN